ncbi:hypothetical protein MTP99_002667 [Tenebrio molitor]|jgi:hypothetical protein|nr:hypothetical protein MTP99_002667 [Tenebrio molitor]
MGKRSGGRKEQEEVEKVQEKYFRVVLGVDRERRSYMVREACKRNKLRQRKLQSSKTKRMEGKSAGLLERKEKEHGEEGDREIPSEKRECQ